MILWLKIFRLPVLGMAALLTLQSFKLSGLKTEVSWPLLFILTTALATMLLDDWLDRKVLLCRPEKKLAKERRRIYLSMIIIAWVLSLVSAWGCIFKYDYQALYGVLPMILIGIGYSLFRRIPLMSAVIVATVWAVIAIFPVVIGLAPLAPAPALLGGLVFAIVLCRELLNDLRDYQIDCGVKKTMPQIFSYDFTVFFLIAATLVYEVVLFLISFWLLPTAVASALAMYILVKSDNAVGAKNTLDVGLAYGLLIFLFLGTT